MAEADPSGRDELAIVLDGGGARAAYQVGLLRRLVKNRPDLDLPIITGVSAGAINAGPSCGGPPRGRSRTPWRR